MTEPHLLVASNRGPVAFVKDPSGSGEVIAQRGGGGLVTALSGALQEAGGVWVAAAMTEEDRAQAKGRRRLDAPGVEGYQLRYLVFDPAAYDRFYNGVSNRTLWFLHHALWDIPRTPAFDAGTRADWQAYREVNGAFAEALDREATGMGTRPNFLIQDYHLSLVPAMLRERRPHARIAHFSHIPFASPNYLRILPADMRDELLAGLLGADVVGFQAQAWADSFLGSVHAVLGARVNQGRRVVQWEGREVRIGVYPVSIDPEDLERQAAGPRVLRARRELLRWLDGAKLVVRVDRTEPSKNVLRGFAAFRMFLDGHPEWRGRVRMLAHLNPSREGVPEYRRYLKECRAEVERINGHLGRGGWEPIRLSLKDDYPTALAAYSLYDVLLVNSVFDGMNLVAKEGPILNGRAGAVILSENAGAAAELGRYALMVNPFDVAATADAIAAGLEMAEGERRRRAEGLQRAVRRNRLSDWVSRQVADLSREDGP